MDYNYLPLLCCWKFFQLFLHSKTSVGNPGYRGNKCETVCTYVVSLIKHNNRCLFQFFRNQVSYFRIQEIMVAVYNNISMVDLKWYIRKKSKFKANKIFLEGLFN